MNNSSQTRVGLLLCDDIDEEVRAQHGTYTEIFSNAFQDAESNLTLHPIACYQGEFPNSVDDYDAFLISGSRQAAYDTLPWILQLQEFVRSCWEQRKKTVGICFGHQVIAHALGGETKKADVGWGIGIHQTQITKPQKWMKDSQLCESDNYNLIVLHQDQVVTLPPGFSVIAKNDFCPISMYVADDVMLGIQGHPEFDKAFCEYRLGTRKEKLSEDVYSNALDSLQNMELDSTQVMGWVARFICL